MMDVQTKRTKTGNKEPSKSQDKPSPEYLQTVEIPSQTLEPNTPPLLLPRKLIILDLVGTLLWRNPTSTKSQTSRIPRKSKKEIILRPYLPSLIDYLFHPDNLPWCDVMIWTSVSPKNARPLIEQVFGKDEFISDNGELSVYRLHPETARLKAIWTGESLGFSYEQGVHFFLYSTLLSIEFDTL